MDIILEGDRAAVFSYAHKLLDTLPHGERHGPDAAMAMLLLGPAAVRAGRWFTARVWGQEADRISQIADDEEVAMLWHGVAGRLSAMGLCASPLPEVPQPEVFTGKLTTNETCSLKAQRIISDLLKGQQQIRHNQVLGAVLYSAEMGCPPDEWIAAEEDANKQLQLWELYFEHTRRAGLYLEPAWAARAVNGLLHRLANGELDCDEELVLNLACHRSPGFTGRTELLKAYLEVLVEGEADSGAFDNFSAAACLLYADPEAQKFANMYMLRLETVLRDKMQASNFPISEESAACLMVARIVFGQKLFALKGETKDFSEQVRSFINEAAGKALDPPAFRDKLNLLASHSYSVEEMFQFAADFASRIQDPAQWIEATAALGHATAAGPAAVAYYPRAQQPQAAVVAAVAGNRSLLSLQEALGDLVENQDFGHTLERETKVCCFGLRRLNPTLPHAAWLIATRLMEKLQPADKALWMEVGDMMTGWDYLPPPATYIEALRQEAAAADDSCHRLLAVARLALALAPAPALSPIQDLGPQKR